MTTITPHESLARLIKAVQDMHPDERVGPSAVARMLGVSPQVITNWRQRGVSDQGALSAQSTLGINASYILDGRMPVRIGGSSHSVQQQRLTLAAIGRLTDHVNEVTKGLVSADLFPQLAAAINQAVAEVGAQAIVDGTKLDTATDLVGRYLRAG